MHETQSTNYPRLNGTHHLIKRSVPFEFKSIYSSLTLIELEFFHSYLFFVLAKKTNICNRDS